MGIVSDEDFLKEKASLENIIVPIGEVRDIKGPGRGNGSAEVPNEVRKIIGEVGIVNRQDAIALAASVGISPSSASAYARGASSLATYNEPQPSLKNHVDKVRGRIVKRAKNRLLDALDAITPDKLLNAELKEASSVARDMSVIIKNMEENVDNGKAVGQQNNFILFRPLVRSEDAYETIYSKE